MYNHTEKISSFSVIICLILDKFWTVGIGWLADQHIGKQDSKCTICNNTKWFTYGNYIRKDLERKFAGFTIIKKMVTIVCE